MNAMKRILDQYVSNRKSIGPNSNPVSVRYFISPSFDSPTSHF